VTNQGEGAIPTFYLTFFLDKKSKQKNPGKPERLRPFAWPAHGNSMLFIRTAHDTYHFQEVAYTISNPLFISVAIFYLAKAK